MSKADEQADLADFFHTTDREEKSFTKTIVLPLETSNTKTEYVADVIDSWQEMADRMADVLKSHRPSQWRANQTVTYQAVSREFPDKNGVKSTLAATAGERVAEAYDSWKANGQPSDNHPNGQFGDGKYATFRGSDLSIEPNARGYGVKVSAVPYNPEWFHVRTEHNDRLEEYCARIVDSTDELTSGRGEIRLDDGGNVRLHLSVTEDIEVYKPGAVDRYLGVDLGERTIYSTALVEGDEIGSVTVEPGREFRHHRDRLQQKRDEFQAQGDKPAEMSVSNERERYTDHMTHVKSREVVDIAIDTAPCAIVLEDLTNYRKTADDPIHDWPHNQLQEKIMYKATEAGIPVVTIDPSGTSATCRKCGCDDPVCRSGDRFDCLRCDYEVHADVNAAINIARRGDE